MLRGPLSMPAKRDERGVSAIVGEVGVASGLQQIANRSRIASTAISKVDHVMQGRRAGLVLDGGIVACPQQRAHGGDLAVPTGELESVLGIPCDQRSIDGDA